MPLIADGDLIAFLDEAFLIVKSSTSANLY